MTNLINELKFIIDQGGIVLWFMVLLSVVLFTLLSSTWLVLRKVKNELAPFRNSMTHLTDPKLIQEEVALFELKEISWVNRRMPNMSVLLALAPLSGLLGTVSGLLNTFSGLASASTAKPIDSISSGISEALITTQIGLIIAVPAAFLYAFIRGELGKVIQELDQLSSQQLIKIGVGQ